MSSVPDRAALIVSVVFGVAALLAAFGVMHWWLFVPLAALAVVATWRVLPQALPAESQAHGRGALIAVVLAAVWFVVQLPFAAEYLVATRDPGIYMLSGAVIAHTGGSPIDVGQAATLAQSMPGLSEKLGAFGSADGATIRLQGSNGFPALLAIGYWIAGVQGAMIVNLVIGAIGLLAVYALARRIVGAYWAIVPSVLLGIAMPYVYLARATYTEVLAALLLVAASTWIISAFGTRRLSDFAVAGALFGAAGLTRVDGALGFAGALFGLIVVVVGVGRRSGDRELRWRVLLFVAAGWAALGLGIVDLLLNNPRYLHDLGSLPQQLWLFTGALTLVLVALCVSGLAQRELTLDRGRRPTAIVATAVLALLFVFWFSRPWWMVNHNIKTAPYQNAIAGLQNQDGLPLDPSRSYDEYSLWWFGWYFGWVFLGLAAIGMCMWLRRSILDREPGNVVVLGTAAVVALLYLNLIKITPDQVWAFRRVLPVIATTLVIGAAVAMRWCWRRRGKWRWLAVLGLAGSLIGTLLPWGKIFFVVEGSGQAKEIISICRSLEGAEVIAMVGRDAPPNFALTVRSVCSTQVVTVGDAQDFEWAELADRVEGEVGVLSFSEDAVPWARPPEDSITTVVHSWSRHLLMTPRTASLSVRTAFTGFLDEGGTVVPAPL